MDPVLLTNLVVGVVSLLVGHLHLLPFLPAPTPKPPVVPTSVGHGEILKYLEQLVVNAVSSAPPTPVPVGPSNVDVAALLQRILALLEKK